MKVLDPRWLQRHLRKVVLLLGAALLFFGLRDLRLVQIAVDDDSTPTLTPGVKAIVRTLADDTGALERGALYLVDLTGQAERIDQLRAARLVGLPGDRVVRCPAAATASGEPSPRLEFEIGGYHVTLPVDLADLFPDSVPEGHCLLLTDNPACHHLDSRALGPLPVERLRLRVVASLGSFR